MTEPCELYGISRKTGYKFVHRYLSDGPEALEERSRSAVNRPNQTPDCVVEALRELRRAIQAGAPRAAAVASKAPSTVASAIAWHRFGDPHERTHRTLKAETTRPPANSCRGQQRKFDRFREEFNFQRPHEALDMQTPASM
jgi:hypothetical protein